MIPSTPTLLTLAAASIVLSLSGCGGGGGNQSSIGDQQTTGISGVSLNGVAAKGIIRNGRVVAEELNNTGAVVRQVGTTETGADGSYEITVGNGYQGGPIQITISTDADTQMKCDVAAGCGSRSDAIDASDTTVDFGEWYTPGTLNMAALVPEAAANNKLNVNITPYTDLAARRAKANGTLNASTINSANSEVSNLLGGIDILRTRPLDITDPNAVNEGNATEIAYAAFGAAIAELAKASGSANPDINNALQRLADSFANGQIPADDADSLMDEQFISLKEIIDAAKNTFSHVGITDISGIIAALVADIDDAEDNDGDTLSEVDPAPSDTAGADTMTKVKAMVSDLRTWGAVLFVEANSGNGAFGEKNSLAVDVGDMGTDFLINPALEATINAVILNLSGTYSDGQLTGYGLGFTSGTISQSNGQVSITEGEIDGFTVNISLNLPEDQTTGSALLMTIDWATFTSTALDANITDGSILVNLASSYTVDYDAVESTTAPLPDITGASIELDIALMKKQDAIGQNSDRQVTFKGTLESTLTNPIKDEVTGEYAWITPSILTLTGEISSSTGHTLEGSFSANIDNADSFEPVGKLPKGTVTENLVTWIVSDTDSAPGDDTFTLTAPNFTYSTYWSSDDQSVVITTVYDNYKYPYSTTLHGYSSLADYLNTISNAYFYTWADEGQYYVDLSSGDLNINSSISGILEVPTFIVEGGGEGEWLDADFGLNFSLQLEDLPEATINISGDRSGFDDGTATITIAFGNRQISIEGTVIDGETRGSTVVITNQDGVEVTIEQNDRKFDSGVIRYNGTTYAEMETLSNGLVKITYTDGSFETL